MFRKKRVEYVPRSELPNLDAIYGSRDVQSSYETGSPTRLGIEHAYLAT